MVVTAANCPCEWAGRRRSRTIFSGCSGHAGWTPTSLPTIETGESWSRLSRPTGIDSISSPTTRSRSGPGGSAFGCRAGCIGGRLGVLVELITQIRQRRPIRMLIAEHGINVVHQCYPDSPAKPSLCRGSACRSSSGR